VVEYYCRINDFVGLTEGVGLQGGELDYKGVSWIEKSALLYLLLFICRLYRISPHVFLLVTSLKTD